MTAAGSSLIVGNSRCADRPVPLTALARKGPTPAIQNPRIGHGERPMLSASRILIPVAVVFRPEILMLSASRAGLRGMEDAINSSLLLPSRVLRRSVPS